MPDGNNYDNIKHLFNVPIRSAPRPVSHQFVCVVVYRNLDSSTKEAPDITKVRSALRVSGLLWRNTKYTPYLLTRNVYTYIPKNITSVI